ncbi:unnamed protein product [Toxocara canis]|uniref:E3 ubiquitin-protein ligase RNF170 n=1 Tax=Toxocara canis TaxID=6265 RepID=A0A3P7IKV1_TOXCA|nr:unnamed protein product [Toxocara canis]
MGFEEELGWDFEQNSVGIWNRTRLVFLTEHGWDLEQNMVAIWNRTRLGFGRELGWDLELNMSGISNRTWLGFGTQLGWDLEQNMALAEVSEEKKIRDLLQISLEYSFSPDANRIHPTLEAAMDEFRRVFRGERGAQATPPPDGDVPPRQYGQDRTCPICYGPSSFAVLTNCGHLFCCNCIYGYWRHSASLVTPVKCAVCRSVVSVLMPLPLEGERENNIDEAVQSDLQLNEYNRRFSGEPRPLLDYIRDLPVLLPYMLRTLLSVNGLMWMFRIRVFLCLIGVLIYVLSPFDILPESALGVLGMLDDVFIAFVVLVYATVLFRQLMAGGRMRFGWEMPGDD